MVETWTIKGFHNISRNTENNDQPIILQMQKYYNMYRRIVFPLQDNGSRSAFLKAVTHTPDNDAIFVAEYYITCSPLYKQKRYSYDGYSTTRNTGD